MKISRLAGLYTGQGFRKKDGRRPTLEDATFVKGPLDIVVEGGRIQAIRPSEAKIGEADFCAEGLFATSAWFDSHTHALFEGERSSEFFLRWQGAQYADIAAQGGGIHNTNRATEDASDFELQRNLGRRLDQMRRSGVTGAEVKTGYSATPEGELRLLRVLKAYLESTLGKSGPRCYRTFLPLHALPKGVDEKTFVDAMISLIPTIAKEALADGVDAFPDKGFFSLSESLRFSKIARANGLNLKIHADEITPVGASEAFAELGALSVDHLQRISQLGLDSLSRTSTVAALLPATSFFLGIDYAPARKIIDAGARFALASDFNPGTAPVYDFRFTQLLAASQMKLSPAEILCASTFGAAAALGWEENLGTIEEGKFADLLLWEARSPHSNSWLAELFTNLQPPTAIFQAGQLVGESKHP